MLEFNFYQVTSGLVRFRPGCRIGLSPARAIKVILYRFQTAIYICVLSALLLEATSSVLFPAKYKHRQPNSWVVRNNPAASASPMPSAFSADSANAHKSYGYINCMLAVHSDISRCNNSYHQSLSNLVVKGYKKESKLYRRQFCCGFWNRERCVSDAIQRKCDRQTFQRIVNDKSPYAIDVDTRHSLVNCDGFEQNSHICSSARSLAASENRLLAFINLVVLILLHCVM